MHLVLLTGSAGVDLARDLATRHTLSVVAATTRDAWVDGLKRSPVLDAFLVPPGPATFGVAETLDALGFGVPWHRASDAETALRIVRTELLHAGYSLTEATAAMARRRELGYALLPLSDDRGELHVVHETPEGRRAVHLDEARSAGQVDDATPVVLVGQDWAVAPAVVEAVAAADAVLVDRSTHEVRHALEAVEPHLLGRRVVDVAAHPADAVLRALEALR